MIGMEKYAFKNRKIKESYLRKYQDRSPVETASKASRCNSIQQSREEPEEGKINESIREEIISEAHQEGRQGVLEANQGYPGPDQGRCEVEEIPKNNRKKMKKSAEKKHEAKETKAYEKKEDKKESKGKKK